MARMTSFDSPLMLGFDHLERMLDRISKSGNDGYPPYNIEQIGDNALRITLAVAGFSMDDLEVGVEDSQLTIRGKQGEDDGERFYLHRGIAARQFTKTFVLAECIEVTGATLDNGLLHIELERPEPEQRHRVVPIRQREGAAERARIVGSQAQDG